MQTLAACPRRGCPTAFDFPRQNGAGAGAIVSSRATKEITKACRQAHRLRWRGQRRTSRLGRARQWRQPARRYCFPAQYRDRRGLFLRQAIDGVEDEEYDSERGVRSLGRLPWRPGWESPWEWGAPVVHGATQLNNSGRGAAYLFGPKSTTPAFLKEKRARGMLETVSK